ncbi:GAF and ANTAR domain-containing protein [Mycolicibacterium lacusdiani]|uniref:GAF and ANTAR domain-containing protein n=1 Tax=Mycolicibacterium lacusdiani TaxID=2895283 RepID=UPI001F38FC05|nr:GAF and ANTAR domain-containing protein [Mycolicibacterium lacusdiani]
MTSREDHDTFLRTAMHDIADHLSRHDDIGDTLASVTASAVELIDGIDYADVLMITDGEFRSVKPTTPMLSELDQLQQQAGEGPCLEAVVTDSIIRCPDLSSDERWPRFAAGAVERGVYSMLSFQLYTTDNGGGALNLFGRKRQTFDTASETVGAMLATQAAIAIIASNRHTQFESALASRDLIGQAKGILMERFSIDSVAAFNMLRTLSQTSNEKLWHIAQRVVDSR